MISSFPELESYSKDGHEENRGDEGRPGGLGDTAPSLGSPALGPGRAVVVERRSTTPSQPSVVVTAPVAPEPVAPDMDPGRLSAVEAWKAVAANAEGRYRKLVRLAVLLVGAFDSLRAHDEFSYLETYRGAAEVIAQLLQERGQVRREMEARDRTIRRLQNENQALRRQAELPLRL